MAYRTRDRVPGHHSPARAGRTGVAFCARDLDAERDRLRGAAIPEASATEVAGFDGLTYVEFIDSDGVATGLLNAEAVADGSPD